MMISLGILPTHTIVLKETASKWVVNLNVETVYDEIISYQSTLLLTINYFIYNILMFKMVYNIHFQLYAILR